MERKKTNIINNAFYDELGRIWTESTDHPIAILRAENALRNPWIAEVLHKCFPYPCKVLDVGCGAGFLTNELAKKGHIVRGVDLSEKSLELARSLDETRSVEYRRASAYELPYPDGIFDAVFAMNLLEHVENPAVVIKEANRLLKKGGLFFFCTFNRNLLSYFLIIKGLKWCFANVPRNIHAYPLFIKPQEIGTICSNHNLTIKEIKGCRPNFSKKAFWKMVLTKRVDKDFRFIFTDSTKTGYIGYSVKGCQLQHKI